MPASAWVGWYPLPPSPIPPSDQPLLSTTTLGNFRRLGPYMDPFVPFSVPTTLAGPISTHDTTAAALSKSATPAVDAGAPPCLVVRPPVVAPPSTISATAPALPGPPASKISIYSPPRTRAPSQGTSEVFAIDHAPGRLPPPVGVGPTAGAHFVKIIFNIAFSTSGTPLPETVVEPYDVLPRSSSSSSSPPPVSHSLRTVLELDDDVSSGSTPTQPRGPRPSTPPPLHLPKPVVEPDDDPHLSSCLEHSRTQTGRGNSAPSPSAPPPSA